MLDRPIAVLGGGNGAQTMAADLALAGHDVHLYEHPSFGPRVARVLETRSIELTGVGRTGVGRLRCATTRMAEALEDTRLVNVVVPALGHDLFFRELIPHLNPGQVVIVWSGDFGSLRLAHLLQQAGRDDDVELVETNTIPYGARISSAGRVNIFLQASTVTLAALPSCRTGRILGPLRELWPAVTTAANVLAAGLSNPNPLCHPPGALLNVGRIEYSRGDFHMYREGITEAVARVIRALYGETIAVADALALTVIRYQDQDFMSPGCIMSKAFTAPFDTQGVIGGIRGPTSIHDRYLVEDLPFGLVPISQLGDRVDVDTPLIDAVVCLGSHVCGQDFWTTGRTLETLGLTELKPSELLAYVNDGALPPHVQPGLASG